ncbi:MAG: hypothetical protein R3E08_09310 [Thiotrichaceae bacterium]
MKNFCYTCLLGIVLQGCSATSVVYGVPEPEWQRMSAAQQQQTMQQFQRQEQINTATRAAAETAKDEAQRFSETCRTPDTLTLPDCQVKTRRHFGF